MNRTIDSFLEETLKNKYYHLWSVMKRTKERSHKIQKLLAPPHLKDSYISSYEIAGEVEAGQMLSYCQLKYGQGEDFELEEIERTI